MNEFSRAYVPDREAIEKARSMSISEKFLAGARLFEEECDATRAEIRLMNPDWNEEQVEAELNRRLDVLRDEKTALLAKMRGISDGKNSEP
jgi:hypothetical protein